MKYYLLTADGLDPYILTGPAGFDIEDVSKRIKGPPSTSKLALELVAYHGFQIVPFVELDVDNSIIIV